MPIETVARAEEVGAVSLAACVASHGETVSIETIKLSRTVHDRPLVRDVSIKVRRGDILAVAGPSGAGKSSFLRLLNRLDEPTSGQVLVDGEDYRGMDPRDLRRRFGMVMQMPFLFPGRVAANLAFGPAQRGERLTSGQTAELLERVGLPGYQDRDVSHLSGGEAQRVSIARTLANEPDALLLDEPTSALDEASARGIEELVCGIVEKRRIACVIVTHNKAQALRIATRTMIMEAGHVTAIGPTKDMLNDH
jgi:putative ABC transport system ATP-binding protein